MLDDKRVAMIRSHEFQLLAIDVGSRFTDAHVETTEVFSGSECYVLRMKDGFGDPLDAYFHTNSHLLAGMRLPNHVGEGEAVWIRYVEWTNVNDVLLPSKVIATDSSGDFVLSFREMALNDVEEDLFSVPEEVRGG